MVELEEKEEDKKKEAEDAEEEEEEEKGVGGSCPSVRPCGLQVSRCRCSRSANRYVEPAGSARLKMEASFCVQAYGHPPSNGHVNGRRCMHGKRKVTQRGVNGGVPAHQGPR